MLDLIWIKLCRVVRYPKRDRSLLHSAELVFCCIVAWHFWLSTRFSCCLEQFQRFSQGSNSNILKCSQLILLLDSEKSSYMQQDAFFFAFLGNFLYWNEVKIWRNYCDQSLFISNYIIINSNCINVLIFFDSLGGIQQLRGQEEGEGGSPKSPRLSTHGGTKT